MGRLEAGECSSKTVVKTVPLLNPTLVKVVDQADSPALMMLRLLLGLSVVAVYEHSQNCLKVVCLTLASAHLWAYRRTKARGERDYSVSCHMLALSSLSWVIESVGDG